jgi:hypothetical protein
LACEALLLGASLWPRAGHAAPVSVEAFDAGAWRGLQAAQKLPTAVVFSTTDCVHCPAVIERLVHDLRRRKLKASVIAVVMDAAPGESDAALLAEPHYRQADRLFAFSGQVNSLRFGIDPRWRGVTPFVALWVPGGPVRFVTGPPTAAQVQAWLGGSAGSAAER